MKRAGLTTTVVFSVLMTFSGTIYLLGVPQAVAAMHTLGYPDYFRVALGACKLLGVAMLWLPVPRTLREWAYAGFAFDLVAGAVSHAAADSVAHAVPPLLALGALLVSYFFRHRFTNTAYASR
jgi:hypothetical protein